MSKAKDGILPRRTSKGELRYRAEVYDKETGRREYKTCDTRAEARVWRRERQTAFAKGTARASVPITLADLWDQWLVKAKAGEVRARGGTRYKPSVTHSYELLWTGRLRSKFGSRKVADLRRADVQRAVDSWVSAGLAGADDQERRDRPARAVQLRHPRRTPHGQPVRRAGAAERRRVA